MCLVVSNKPSVESAEEVELIFFSNCTFTIFWINSLRNPVVSRNLSFSLELNCLRAFLMIVSVDSSYQELQLSRIVLLTCHLSFVKII